MSKVAGLTVVQRVTGVGVLALALSAGLGWAVVLPKWEALQTAQAEQEGLGPASDVLRLVQLTQEHRGMSAALLAGNADFAARRQAKQAEVDAALTKALASTAIWADPPVTKARDALQSPWQGLSQAVAAGSLKAPESFGRHTALIQVQLKLLDVVTSASTIALDPHAQTYYLTQAALTDLPQATEALGQLRARGAAAMKQESLSPSDRALFTQMLGFAQQRFARVSEQLRRAEAVEPPALAAVMAELRKAESALAATETQVRTQLIDTEKPTGNAANYFDTLTATIDQQYALSGVAFKAAGQAFEQRVAGSWRTMGLTAAAMALLMAGIVAVVLQVRQRIAHNAAQAMAAAAHIAQGDFTHPVRSEHADEFGALVNALEQSRQRMAAAVGSVRDGVHAVALASQQIAQGNGELASRTESQASSLQETAASMEQITHTVTQSSTSAQQAKGLADQASAAAERGGEVVGEVVTTMQDIAASSRRIAEIIGVIDGIAFQTNILALNAAVEAARAGEQGRGFAVVASEVRSLAQRSADAAREIKEMISSSVQKVESGTRLVDGAGASMADIVDQVRRVTELINQISQHSVEQSASLTQVNAAVSQMEQVTQRNAAHVEESAAAAEEMRNQAQSLAHSMDQFRLG